MKKVFKVMSCALLAVTLTGCGNNPTPSNGNDIVVSLSKGELKINVDDLYKTLKETYATNYIIGEIDKAILSKEYETDEKAQSYAENQLKIAMLYYENNETNLLNALKSAGYDSLEAYKEYLIVNYKRTLAAEDYVRKNISDNEINKYYDDNVYGDVTISHILVKLEASDNLTDEENQEAQKKANEKIDEILKKLKEGKTFSEVAKEYSDDTITASNGGRLGTYNKAEMSKQFNNEFEAAVINLKVGNYTTKAIKTSYGYHIIYKDSEKEKPAIETIKQTIIDNLVDEKLKEDDKAQYKALIDLRQEYGLTFNDQDVENQYNNAVNNWLYGE